MAKARVFDAERLARYLEAIAWGRACRRTHVETAIGRLRATLARAEACDEAMDQLIAKVNMLRDRRHNVIGIAWKPDRRVANPITQPQGPFWYKVFHGRDGRRHRAPIKKLTIDIIKKAFQGRDVGELRRLAARIKKIQQLRDQELDAITDVVRRLQHKTTQVVSADELLGEEQPETETTNQLTETKP